jgi:predicted DCC family thiol-disulfide oxidoreductase YuxK
MSAPAPAQHALVLFDGDCAFCNASVLWIIRRNPNDTLRFAPLESAEGRRALSNATNGLDRVDAIDTNNTMVLIDARGVHSRSTAALRIASHLTRPWPTLAALGHIIPRGNRHRLFAGATCELPTPEMRRRVLTDFDVQGARTQQP